MHQYALFYAQTGTPVRTIDHAVPHIFTAKMQVTSLLNGFKTFVTS
jgi:hypothetical protein